MRFVVVTCLTTCKVCSTCQWRQLVAWASGLHSAQLHAHNITLAPARETVVHLAILLNSQPITFIMQHYRCLQKTDLDDFLM